MQSPDRRARRGVTVPGTSQRAAAASALHHASLLASFLFIASVMAIAWLAGSLALAIYALAFWHYLLYALAYRYGAVPIEIFKRDAVLMKGVSLLALASVYVAAGPDVVSLVVVAAGFLLNALAAAVLGSDRTYYGHEVAGLPRMRVTRFPYSVIPHPMLAGNMLAYGGLLLDDGFRAQWWPLACIHVALNLGLLLMERDVMPLKLGVPAAPLAARPWAWARRLAQSAGVAAVAGGSAWLVGLPAAPLAAALGAVAALYVGTLLAVYVVPGAQAGAPHPFRSETSP